MLLPLEEPSLIQDLVEAQSELVGADPNNQEIRLSYAQTLAAVVRAQGDLPDRERVFKVLFELCKAAEHDVTLYEPLAAAALALCAEYAAAPTRLPDAEAQNRLIRSVARSRAERPLYRARQAFSFEYERVEDDLRRIRLYLVDSDAELIGPWTLAERFTEASQLVDEVMGLWRRFHKTDVEFARGWAGVVVRHADARASQGAAEQVIKAIDALQDAAAEFAGDLSFIRIASELARAAIVRAASRHQLPTAIEILTLLRQVASRGDAPREVTADYAEAALSVCVGYQQQQDWAASTSTARSAAYAIRSEAHQQRLRERGADDASIAEIIRWTAAVEAGDD
jgi:hypothetical protein